MPKTPVISAEAKYFLKVMMAVILICCALIGFVWMFSSAYRGYQHQGGEQQINVHIENAERHFKNQSYQAAIEEYNQVLKVAVDPKLVKVTRRNVAACYLRLGDESDRAGRAYDAIGQYKQALVYDQNYAEPYVFLGNAYRRLGQNDAAFAAWENAWRAEPGSEAAVRAKGYAASLYVDLGDRENNSGRADKANEYWRKAMETAPGTKAAMAAQERIEQATGTGRSN
jgi:tetratricopeptide (TPR) repeat protein